MSNEIERRPRTVTSRMSDWLGEKIETLTEKFSTVMLSIGMANVATKQATRLNTNSLEEMGKGMSAAIDVTRAMKAKISADDEDEQDIYELFKCATIAHTRLMTDALASGISTQPIDREQLANPTVKSFSLPSASRSEGLNDLQQEPENEPTEQDQEEQQPTLEPQKKRGGGRPQGSKDKTPRARKKQLKTP